jgi:hypothetical protein
MDKKEPEITSEWFDLLCDLDDNDREFIASQSEVGGGDAVGCDSPFAAGGVYFSGGGVSSAAGGGGSPFAGGGGSPFAGGGCSPFALAGAIGSSKPEKKPRAKPTKQEVSECARTADDMVSDLKPELDKIEDLGFKRIKKFSMSVPNGLRLYMKGAASKTKLQQFVTDFTVEVCFCEGLLHLRFDFTIFKSCAELRKDLKVLVKAINQCFQEDEWRAQFTARFTDTNGGKIVSTLLLDFEVYDSIHPLINSTYIRDMPDPAQYLQTVAAASDEESDESRPSKKLRSGLTQEFLFWNQSNGPGEDRLGFAYGQLTIHLTRTVSEPFEHTGASDTELFKLQPTYGGKQIISGNGYHVTRRSGATIDEWLSDYQEYVDTAQETEKFDHVGPQRCAGLFRPPGVHTLSREGVLQPTPLHVHAQYLGTDLVAHAGADHWHAHFTNRGAMPIQGSRFYFTNSVLVVFTVDEAIAAAHDESAGTLM